MQIYTVIPPDLASKTRLKKFNLVPVGPPVAAFAPSDDEKENYKFPFYELFEISKARSRILQLPSNNPQCTRCGGVTEIMNTRKNKFGRWQSFLCLNEECENKFTLKIIQVKVVEAEAFT